jgi:hypothetical protein
MSEGTLTGSSTIVGGAGKVSGTGSISNLLAINNPGTVSPGDVTGPGILTLTAIPDLSGMTLAFRLNGPGAGTGYDQLRVTDWPTPVWRGQLKLTGTASYAPGTVLTIIDSPKGIQGTFAGLADGATVKTVDGAFFRIN